MLSFAQILAAFDFQFGGLIPIVAIVAPFAMVIAIQVSKSIARTQQERMRCDVIRTAIERGQPIPPETFRPLPDDDEAGVLAEINKAPSPRADIRAGLICVAVGFGLYLMFATFEIGNFDGLRGLRWVGAIPGFVGVALIINGLINRPTPTPPDRPAHSRDDLRS